MAKKSALGKGLGALIKQPEINISEKQAFATNKIDISLIEVNPYQPRTRFDNESLEELAASIKQLGIIQPITVREISDDKYQIISGERRYRASLIAGLSEIPAYIRQAEDNNMLEMALVENIQREDLDAIEIAISYQCLIEECQLTQENLSERVGKKRSTIANYLRLLKLPPEIQMAIKQKQISMGHARALVNIENTDNQLQLFHQIIENELSVRQVETAVREMNQPKVIEHAVVEIIDEPDPSEDTINIEEDDMPEEVSDEPSDELSDEEIIVYEDTNLPEGEDEQKFKERLSNYFGTKVDLKRNSSGAGRVVIPFRTDAEFQYILQMAEKIVVLEN